MEDWAKVIQRRMKHSERRRWRSLKRRSRMGDWADVALFKHCCVIKDRRIEAWPIFSFWSAVRKTGRGSKPVCLSLHKTWICLEAGSWFVSRLPFWAPPDCAAQYRLKSWQVIEEQLTEKKKMCVKVVKEQLQGRRWWVEDREEEELVEFGVIMVVPIKWSHWHFSPYRIWFIHSFFFRQGYYNINFMSFVIFLLILQFPTKFKFIYFYSWGRTDRHQLNYRYGLMWLYLLYIHLFLLLLLLLSYFYYF